MADQNRTGAGSSSPTGASSPASAARRTPSHEARPTIKGRPYRAGKPFRCFRDPARKSFGFINKIAIMYLDGQEPIGEVFTLAQFNKLVGKDARRFHFETRPE